MSELGSRFNLVFATPTARAIILGQTCITGIVIGRLFHGELFAQRTGTVIRHLVTQVTMGEITLHDLFARFGSTHLVRLYRAPVTNVKQGSGPDLRRLAL